VIAASEHLPHPDWAGIAAAAGYFDQGHMIRDFAGLAGLTPAAYHRRLLPGAGLIEA
jgi:AraC-like DNA-binding protein